MNTGLKRRLTKGSIWYTVEYRGKASDVFLKDAKRTDSVSRMTWSVFQSKLFGALDRLRRQHTMGLRLPPKIESAILANAHKAMESKR